MAELGGEAQATVIGPSARLPAANAAFANAMLCHGLDFDDTHSDSVSHVATVICPASLAAGEANGTDGRERAGGDRRRQRGRRADRHGRLGRVPRARLPPDGDLRDLRRDRRDGRLAGADAAHDDERARHRRLVRGGALRLPRRRRRRRSRCTPPGPRTAASSPRGSRALGAEGPPVGARGQVRPLPRLPRRGRRARSTSTGSSPTSARAGRRRGSPTSRIPVCHFMHGSLGATADALDGRTLAPDEIDGRRSSPSPQPASRSCSSRPTRSGRRARDYEGKFCLQYSVASMLVRGHVGRRATSPTRRSPTRAVLARRGEGALRDAGLPLLPAGVPRRRARHARGRARRSRRDFPYQKGGPENPMSADEVRAKFRENASLALGDARAGGARGGDPRARGAGRPRGGARAADARPEVAAYDRRRS